MRPRPFEYFAASTVNEALDLITTREDAKILAGGQSLLAVMRLRLLTPKTIIDIGRIKELAYVREDAGTVKIGALTTHDTLENNQIIHTNFPLLTDATSVIADQQVRNRGTIGGSLAHADPSADLPTALTALRASVALMGRRGSRTIGCSELVTGYFSTAISRDEMLTEVVIPKPAVRSGGAYLKLSRRHGDFAIVGVAASLALNEAGACIDSSVVLGGVDEKPHHATVTEQTMIGMPLTTEIIGKAAEKASEGLSPPTDTQASSEYRLEMSRVMTRRAIIAASKRAKGVSD